jgi:threonine dehydrogenase-like Zn-dependent dehydrogenase
MFTDEINKVMPLVAKKQVIVDDLISSEHPLSEGVEIFRELIKPDNKEIKVILTNT